MDQKVLEFIEESLKNSLKAAMIILTETKGSSPGKSGSIMAVNQNKEVIGTVGGGVLENTVIKQALESIENQQDINFIHTLTEKGNLEMICGGEAKGFIKVFYPQNKLLIVGAGHIGKLLCPLGKQMDFYVEVVDDRKEYANRENLSQADKIYVQDFKTFLENYQTDKNTYIVIVTRGHAYDTIAIRSLIEKTFAYMGVIGSKTKIQRMKEDLSKDEKIKPLLSKLYAPIGLDIGTNKPNEIALGIMAEILLVKNNKKPMLMKDKYKNQLD